MSNKWCMQSKEPDEDGFALVTDSYCRNGDIRSDFLVFDREDTAVHAHVAYDEYGEEIYYNNPYPERDNQ